MEIGSNPTKAFIFKVAGAAMIVTLLFVPLIPRYELLYVEKVPIEREAGYLVHRAYLDEVLDRSTGHYLIVSNVIVRGDLTCSGEFEVIHSLYDNFGKLIGTKSTRLYIGKSETENFVAQFDVGSDPLPLFAYVQKYQVLPPIVMDNAYLPHWGDVRKSCFQLLVEFIQDRF